MQEYANTDSNENTLQTAGRITPFLWFDGRAEEAMNFYVSIFPNSRVLSVTRCGDAGPGPNGSVLTARFELDGQEFIALNGGPQFKFSEATSFLIRCETQEEVDYYWDRLTDGGSESMCGWLKDKFGLSWQVVPAALGDYLQDKNPSRSARVMGAMLQMRKIDISVLKEAYEEV